MNPPRSYTFGPVPSRRLGMSLGVDVIPRKLCTLDCIYCEVGRTDKKTLARREYFPTQEVLADIRAALFSAGSLDCVTFSGSGEPTLHSGLGSIIRGVKAFCGVPVAVITNGTLLFREDVRRDLFDADIVLPSLDAATAAMFQAVDRPHEGLMIEKIVGGLQQFRAEYKGQLWLEILLVRGMNDRHEEIRKLRAVVDLIKPEKIHLNTVVRPPSESFARPVTAGRLEEICDELGEQCEIVETHDVPRENLSNRIDDERLIQLLERRPLTEEEIARAFHLERDPTADLLSRLCCMRMIEGVEFDGARFYRIPATEMAA